jgi:hypothetical protein
MHLILFKPIRVVRKWYYFRHHERHFELPGLYIIKCPNLNRKGGCASDIDVMCLNGFNFPRYRGGLMYWADTIGVGEVHRQIAAWHRLYGERWAPSPYLRRLAETNTPFRDAEPPRPM